LFEPARAWDDKKKSKFRMLEVHMSGENQNDHHGSKHTGSMPGNRLKLLNWTDARTSVGRRLMFEMTDDAIGVCTKSYFQFYDGIPVVRVWSEVENRGSAPVGLEYVSTFALTGLDKEGLGIREEKMRLHIPHNTWYGEAQWQAYSLPELGLHTVNEFSMKRLSYGSTGTWSTSQYAPMGVLENSETGTSLVWQIEHNGSWHWEISDIRDLLYVQVSGPTEAEHQWWKELKPGESFLTVPAAVGAVCGGIQESIAAMTRYRRAIRRPNEDNRLLPVIFNDYMNCLFGDPTTEKLLPLIDAAAEAGCEYYCIDCGWYSDGYWWDGVGEWLPSVERFPGGIEEVLEYIRGKGMIPGLWLELEVMGVNCRLAEKLPDHWFFMRHGKRVIDHSRYQLDFRNSDVAAYADMVVDRLVRNYGVGYIKMDYNINAGVGTEVDADSFGDGLLEHNRAYLAWLDRVFERYPELVIENCGSGGMRLDYALLSRHSIQSSSDQTDYRKNGVIAAASASLVTPEQCAVWSYPLKEGDMEEVVFNMVNSMLLRIHQSGHLAEISPQRLELVKEGIAYYKSIRTHIAEGLPIWPLGLPRIGDAWISYGLQTNNSIYLAVWRLDSADPVIRLPLPHFAGCKANVRLAYPTGSGGEADWHSANGILAVSLPQIYSARIFEIYGA
jgi:alpha-galactosidase